MKFKDYLANAWKSHATNPKKVAEEIKANLSLMETEDDVMAITKLIVHVFGTHLGEWEKGTELLRKIKNNATIKDKSSMNRYVAVLNLGNNPNLSLDEYSFSDQARIYAATASALVNLGGLKKGLRFIKLADEIIKAELTNTDPANRDLSVASNTIACILEDKAELKNEDAEIMLEAAHLGRDYAEISGTWLEIERAEYRLSRAYFKAKNLSKALSHAEECIQIVSKNGEDPLEVFFAYEAIAIVHQKNTNRLGFDSALVSMKNAFDKLSTENQDYCRKNLEALESHSQI